jgi:NADH dehydrogenase
MKRIVIVGGGFAGVCAALQLANKPGFKVHLITPENYFQYHAALYRSATGRSPLEVAIPLRDFFEYAKNIDVCNDKIEILDENKKQVVGSSGSFYQYDELLLALGNNTAYYGIKGLEKYSYGVKSVQEALKLKRHLHDHLIKKDSECAYVVVGGGATGVELSAEMMSYLHRIRRKHGVAKNDFSVYLVEAADRVLGILPESFTKRVETRLKSLGVKLLLGTAVQAETAGKIILPDSSIATHTVVWTAGVTNNPFFTTHDSIFKFGKLKRVVVNDYLEAAPHIYVLGDSAVTAFSGMAQTALHDARFVTKNLLRIENGKTQITYRPKKPIYAIPVGSRWAAVLWGKVAIFGRLGWLLRRAADLRLYLTFLPLRKALTVWRYGVIDDESCCPTCE